MNKNFVGNFLQHYGRLGMKWGVRNSQGSGSADHLTVSGLKRKKVSEMSNEELKKVANRLELERRYKDLNPSAVRRGGKAVNNILSNLGKVAAAAGTIASLAAAGKKIIDHYKTAAGG
jgi:hypothetical protein